MMANKVVGVASSHEVYAPLSIRGTPCSQTRSEDLKPLQVSCPANNLQNHEIALTDGSVKK